jgi:hypothetical protein
MNHGPPQDAAPALGLRAGPGRMGIFPAYILGIRNPRGSVFMLFCIALERACVIGVPRIAK